MQGSSSEGRLMGEGKRIEIEVFARASRGGKSQD